VAEVFRRQKTDVSRDTVMGFDGIDHYDPFEPFDQLESIETSEIAFPVFE
jgi:hypothetical protein